MSKPNPFKDRQARKAAQAAVPSQQSPLPAAPSPAVSFAQGRAEKMMTLADLPDPVETPDATGDLSEEEEQILALCMQGIKQFENAWWVMGKSMANINSRRLYRKTHATFADFARDVFNKSRPIAYEEMTSYAVGELLSARADKAFEENSNGVSARADTPVIGKKAAGALNPITKDYGPEASVAVHETIQDATGKTVTVKAITGIVQQIPRKADKELTQEELTALARELAANTQPTASPPSDHAGTAPDHLATLREILKELHRLDKLATQDAFTHAASDPAEATEYARVRDGISKAATKLRNRALRAPQVFGPPPVCESCQTASAPGTGQMDGYWLCPGCGTTKGPRKPL